MLWRAILVYGFGNAMLPLTALASTALLSRLFTAAEFGRFTLLITGATIAASLSSQWLAQSINRFLPLAQDAAYQEKGANRYAGIMACVLLLLSVPAVMIDWSAVTVLLYCGILIEIVVRQAVLQARQKSVTYSLLSGGAALARLLIGYLAYLWSPTVTAVIAGYALGTLVALVLFCGRSWLAGVLTRPDSSLHRRYLEYGLPMTVWFFFGNALAVSDRYLIAFFCGTGAAGVYSASYTLASGAVSALATPVALALYPRLMGAWGRGEEVQAIRLSRITALVLTLVGVAGALALVPLAPLLAGFFLGGELRSGASIIPVVFLGAMLTQVGIYLHKPFEFHGLTRQLSYYMAGAAFLNIALNVVVLPGYGYQAAAWTTLVSAFVYAAVVLWRAAHLHLSPIAKKEL